MFEVNKLECENCGWNDLTTFGGSRRMPNPYAAVEKKLQEKLHPRTKRMWEELLVHPSIVMEKEVAKLDYKTRGKEEKKGNLGPLQVKYKTVMGVCSYCETYENYLSFYEVESGESLHPCLCNGCGEKVDVCKDPLNIPCPSCSTELTGVPSRERAWRFNEEVGKPNVIGIGKNSLAVLEKVDAGFNKFGFVVDGVRGEGFECVSVVHDGLIDEKQENVPILFPAVSELMERIEALETTSRNLFLLVDIHSVIDISLFKLVVNRLKYGGFQISVVATGSYQFQGRGTWMQYQEVLTEMKPHITSVITFDKSKYVDRKTWDMEEANKKAEEKLLEGFKLLREFI
ncbi:hypothetical protein [Evansella tamaricis]|uniref:Rubredoxin-like domain-containing protein n=1 Tax=Evansella tamaricis TaxID=2069301 RepID=A0ABS6JJ00_9BACI|nr:hypothetical protein [Evansella tamaricis]MBU9713657.1 hypothetical protein [Evansella tamaricis]